MKKLTLSLLPLALAFSISEAAIKEYAIYNLVGDWDVANGVELDAGDEALDTNTTSPGLFQSIYGDISGNTISREAFKSAVSAAFAAGNGGVIDFEDANLTYSENDWIHPDTGGPIDRTGAAAIQAGNITIDRGSNWYFEGTYDGEGSIPYRGKQTADFDGTGPSGPDRANWSEIFFIVPQSSGSKEELGEKSLGQTSVFDLDFDPADKVVIVGFAYLNYNNFQSQQDTSQGFAFYPNIHAVATFTNGQDSVEQMAVGLTNFVDGGDPAADHYFGFEAPDGYYLDSLLVYQIGNNGRSIPFIDDLGFVQEAAGETWYGYPVAAEQWVDTGAWMGWVNIAFDPWIWVDALSKYVYIGDDSGWAYIPN